MLGTKIPFSVSFAAHAGMRSSPLIVSKFQTQTLKWGLVQAKKHFGGSGRAARVSLQGSPGSKGQSGLQSSPSAGWWYELQHLEPEGLGNGSLT